MPRVLANISDNEGRLTPKLVADLSKDYGAQRSEQETYSQGGKRSETTRSDLRGIDNHARQKRIRIEIELLEKGVSSCDCWMSGMDLATTSTSAYRATKVFAQYTSPLAVDVANGEIDYMRVLRGLRGRSVAWAYTRRIAVCRTQTFGKRGA
jgi:hypothetical protein